jgi:glutamate synthase (NADPH/NADH) small chain
VTQQTSPRPKKLAREERRRKMALKPQEIEERSVEERLGDFDEISVSFTSEQAIAEADRCLLCPGAPCVKACPLGNNLPEAMWLISQGDFIAAANVYRQTSVMPEICSRVCPQKDRLCESACALGNRGEPVALGRLEQFVVDYQRATEGFPKGARMAETGKRVAVVGAGPAGLTVAEILRRAGHSVRVYEAWPYPGGLLIYGIPAFKLGKELVADKIAYLENMDIEFVTNTRVGRDVVLSDLAAQYDAVFLGTGTNVDVPARWDGADLKGVYQAGEFLARANVPPEWLPPELAALGKPEVGRHIFVIGGGDTAMDCVRSALRLQFSVGYELDVTCAYRRTEEQMPGGAKEREHAREEGVKFEWLTAPVRFISDDVGHIKAIEFIRMKLGAPDESGRPRPIKIEGSEYTVPAETAILALGYWPADTLGKTTEGLETHDWGLITADEETGRTSLPNVWAAGDNVHGPDLVSTAVRAAMHAARDMNAYLRR